MPNPTANPLAPNAITGEDLLTWLLRQPKATLTRPIGQVGTYGEFEGLTSPPALERVSAAVSGDLQIDVIRIRFR